MDILNKIIALMNKEELRNYKLFAGRFRDREDRKDIRLFQYIRKSGKKFNERKIIRELYGNAGKSSYYRLKNRLLVEVGKSMSFHQSAKNDQLEGYHLVSLAILYREKQDPEITEYYLHKAEKKASAINNLEMLDLIYGEYISLSFNLKTINPEKYIQLREENRDTLNRFREIDNILAVVSYRIRFAQNFSKEDSSVIDLLRKTVDEFSADAKVRENPRFRFRMYEAVSKILLQQKDFPTLEEYLLDTYSEFKRDKLFDRSNHDTQLQILTYIINALFKNKKYRESLKYVEILKTAMAKYGNLYFDKYLIFYYNSLANNYIELDADKGQEILKEMLEIPEIVRIPIYRVFVTMNLAVFSYAQKQFGEAVKQVVKLRLLESYQTISVAMRLRIEVFEVMARYELGDFEVIEYRINQVKNDFDELLQDGAFSGDLQILSFVNKMIRVPVVKNEDSLASRMKLFIADHHPEDTEFYDYVGFLEDQL